MHILGYLHWASNVTGEKCKLHFLLDSGLYSGCRIQSPALCRIAIKAGLYRKAVQVCYIHILSSGIHVLIFFLIHLNMYFYTSFMFYFLIYFFLLGGQMIVTDLGESNKRADALGKLGLSYGVGMVVGPVLGGVLTKHLG